MDRRQMFLRSLAAPFFAAPFFAKAAGQSGDSATGRQYFELRWFFLRNGSHAPRMLEFLKTHWTPLAARLSGLPVGVFQPMIGEQNPSVLMISAFRNPAEAAGTFDRLMADAAFAAAYANANKPEPAFTRMEATLLRAFTGLPAIALPSDGKTGHIFELRTYESNTMSSLHTKLEMFNGGEIGIFQRLGMMPVFFGEAVFGRNLPSLTYMLAFEDLASRERLWKRFIADTEFATLRSKAGYSDAEIVSTISNSILTPVSFSGIR